MDDLLSPTYSSYEPTPDKPTSGQGQNLSDGRDQYLCDGRDPNEVVISGIAGRFPWCDNVSDFQELLLSKKLPHTLQKERFRKEYFDDFPTCLTIKEYENVDDKCFDVTLQMAKLLDSQLKRSMETVMEGIIDAGFDPRELAGKDIGVYSGIHVVDTLDIGGTYGSVYADKMIRCYMANLLSFWFDFRGTSHVISSNCSSSLDVLMQAFEDINDGVYEAAFVNTMQINILPEILKMLSTAYAPEKSFQTEEKDEQAIFGESICSVFLQKAKDARRVYATIVDVKQFHNGYLPEGRLYSQESMERLMKMTYENNNVSPLDVSYIECDAPYPFYGHEEEKQAIKNVFCESRKDPLLVGAIKRNIGHCGAATGLCGLIKIILGMETGKIFPTLGYDDLSKFEGTDGKLKLVTETLPWNGEYAAINNFGIGGNMFHACLKRNQNCQRATPVDLPRLAVFGTRTEKSVWDLMKFIKDKSPPEEFYHLLNKSIFNSSHLYRGYSLSNGKSITQVVEEKPTERRPLWYVFNAFGTWWPGMGLEMMKFEVFAQSMKRCAETVEKYGIDLFDALRPTSGGLGHTKAALKQTILATMSIQMSLFDLLKSLGLQPDGLVGHSIGDLIACYCQDNSGENLLKVAHYVIDEIENHDVELSNCKVVSVCLTYEEAQKRCPPNVYISSHIDKNLVTLSGLAKDMKKFMANLKNEGITCLESVSCGYPFHTPLVEKPIERSRKRLKEEGVLESVPFAQGFSSSFRRRGQNVKQEFSIDYFCEYLYNPVFFFDAIQRIPKNAVTIEIGPRQVFQRILKNNAEDSINLGVMECGGDNVSRFLTCIAKLYLLDFKPNIQSIYPPAKFPVPRNTPGLNMFLGWSRMKVDTYVRSKVWWDFDSRKQTKTNAYLNDYSIQGQRVFPVSVYLLAAWQAHGEILMMKKQLSESPIVMENIKIFPNPHSVYGKGVVRIKTKILQHANDFEIFEDDVRVASGRIYSPKDKMDFSCPMYVKKGENAILSKEFLYQQFASQGHEYGENFKEINEVEVDGTQCLVQWKDNWVTFLNSVMTLPYLWEKPPGCCAISAIKNVKIDPSALEQFLKEEGAIYKMQQIPVFYDKNLGKSYCSGVEIQHVKWQPLNVQHDSLKFEELRFVPFIHNSALTESQKKHVDNYIALCDKEATKLASRSKESSYIPMGKTLLKSNSVLLSVIQSLHKEMSEKGCIKDSDKVLQRYLRELDNDLLSKTVLTERPLSVIFNIVEENSSQKELVLLEVCHGKHPLSYTISKVRESERHWKYVVTKPSLTTSKALKSIDLQFEVWSKKSSIKADVVLGSFLHGNKDSLEKCVDELIELAKNGFVVFLLKSNVAIPEKKLENICNSSIEVQSAEVLEKILNDRKIHTIARQSDGLGMHVYLLRRIAAQETPIVHLVSENVKTLESKLKKDLPNLKPDSTLWIVDRNPSSGVIGFMNNMKFEKGSDKLRCISVSKEDSTVPSKFDVGDKFWSDILQKNVAINVYKDGVWGSYHKVPYSADVDEVVAEDYLLTMETPGDLLSIHWRQKPITDANMNRPDKLDLCRVYYAGLSYYDVLNAQRVQDTIVEGFGIEFSGRDSKGQRIFGITENSVSSSVVSNGLLTWSVPNSWTLKEACTVPLSYSVAYYALIIQADLKKEQSVLIHCGSGGIGQAAIQLALSMNCEVFATVGSESKKQYLLKKFPKLKPQNIGSSRDISFATLVHDQTDGEGVDVVMNPFSDERFKASFKCVAFSGYFIHIGHKAAFSNVSIGMSIFNLNIALATLNLGDVLQNTCPEDEKVLVRLQKLIQDGISEGVIKPLDSTVFGCEDAVNAFEYLACAKHCGKVLIKIRDEEPEKQATPKKVCLSTALPTSFASSKSCLIMGGSESLALALGSWLVDSGITKIVFSLSCKTPTTQCKFHEESFARRGATCVFSTHDPLEPQNMRKLLEETTSSMGPIGGIFHLGMYEILIENENQGDLDEKCPKFLDTMQSLDKLSQTLCPNLEWFVCFSPMTSPKQHHICPSFCNAVVERICEERQKKGLHGMVFQWKNLGGYDPHSGLDQPSEMKAPLLSIPLAFSTLPYLLRQRKPAVYTQAPISVDHHPISELSHDVLPQLYWLLDEATQEKGLYKVFDDPKVTIYNRNFKPILKLNDKFEGDKAFIIAPQKCLEEVKQFSKSLECPAYGILLTPQIYRTSVEEMAKFVLEIITRDFVNASFHLIGYEFGSLVALEVAQRLQRTNLIQSEVKTLVFIESRDSLNVINLQNENNNTDEISEFITPWIAEDMKWVQETLGAKENDEKAEFLAKILLRAISRRQDMVEFHSTLELECLKQKLKGLYIPSSKLNQNLYFVENEQKGVKQYGLDEITSGEVQVFTVPGSNGVLKGDSFNSVVEFINKLFST